MNNNFGKFKRRARIHSIISSILFGLAGGVLLTSVLTFVSKVSGRESKMVYYLYGMGAALIISVALYYILMPSDRRLAVHLDKLYSLDEKISTMVEFRDNDGEFYRIQREDADEKLGEQSEKKMRSKALLTGIISIAVSIGLFVGSTLMPVIVNTEEEFEEPIDQFDKDWILASLGDLIVTVQNSFMEEKLKTATVNELGNLVEFVKGSEFMSEMKQEAIKTVAAIDSLNDNANTAVIIGEKLAMSTDAKLSDFGTQLKLLSPTEVQRSLADLGSAVISYDVDTRKSLAGEIDSLIDESGVSASDSIHQLIRKITSAMSSGSASATGGAFSEAETQIYNILQIQNVNAYTSGYVIAELCNLFGITAEDLENENIDVIIPEKDVPDTDPNEGGGDKNDDDDNPIGPGGLGTGDIIYGSNDMVFDPNKNEYVPYGDILNEYFAKVNEMINDGKTSEEVAELANYYYALLFGSHNEKTN